MWSNSRFTRFELPENVRRKSLAMEPKQCIANSISLERIDHTNLPKSIVGHRQEVHQCDIGFSELLLELSAVHVDQHATQVEEERWSTEWRRIFQDSNKSPINISRISNPYTLGLGRTVGASSSGRDIDKNSAGTTYS